MITIKPMRYEQADKLEFNKQFKELLNLKIIGEFKSPYGSLTFMVRNHVKIK